MLTPSHNPPEDGGYKYNPPSGGRGHGRHQAIEAEANGLLKPGSGCARGRRPLSGPRPHDFVGAYVADLANVIDLDVIRQPAGIGADPLGGASVAVLPAIPDRSGSTLPSSTTRSIPPSAS